jgi:hypothetical protein
MKINVDGIIIETERERAVEPVKPDVDMLLARIMDLEFAVDDLRRVVKDQ